MYERLVEITVTPELRSKIKDIKKDKTYNQFLSELLEKRNEIPQLPRRRIT